MTKSMHNIEYFEAIQSNLTDLKGKKAKTKDKFIFGQNFENLTIVTPALGNFYATLH